MVSKTFQRSRVFGWHLILEGAPEQNVWSICYYDPNGVDMYKIELDDATRTMGLGLINQIKAWMNQSDTWSGTIVEHWQKRLVTQPAKDVEEWGQI